MRNSGSSCSESVGPPLWLLAELTYRCPLQCPYCSNPLEFAREGAELSTAEWIEVFRQARELGAAQLGFSGGEPLLRQDLAELIEAGRGLGFYTNLITSGIGLDEARLARFAEAGLDHADQLPGRRRRSEQPARRLTQGLRPETGDSPRGEGARLSDGAQLRHPPAQHRQHRADHPAVHRAGSRLRRTRHLPVLRLGRAEPCRAAADPRPTGARRADHRRIPPAAGRRRQPVQADLRHPDYYEERPKACMGGWASVFLDITPTAPRCRVTARGNCRCSFPTCASTACATSGTNRSASTVTAATPGCPNPAVPARRRRGTTAAAAARRSSSPAMPTPPTRSAPSRHGTT